MIVLKAERQRRDWSQAELARRARMNSNTISQIESGRFRPYPSQLRKLGAALGWPAGDDHRLLERRPDSLAGGSSVGEGDGNEAA